MGPVVGLEDAKTLSKQQALRTFKHLALTSPSPLGFPIHHPVFAERSSAVYTAKSVATQKWRLAGGLAGAL